MIKILFGILIGIFIVLALLFGNRKILNPNYQLSIPKFIVDTSKKILAQEDIISLKNQSLTQDEKTGSTNKRIDDILIFGGIIVTLLLAINVGVYINAEKEVSKYFKENYKEHEETIQKHLSEIQTTVGKSKAELELIEGFRKKAASHITPPA